MPSNTVPACEVNRSGVRFSTVLYSLVIFGAAAAGQSYSRSGIRRRSRGTFRTAASIHMHIISIANQKGGVGKSTLSSLFAYFLADKKSARVLAVDLDSQRNLSHTLRQCGIEIPTTALFADA